MNEKYVKEIILNSFVFIIKNNLIHNFVYEDETEEGLMQEAKDFTFDDLDKTLSHFEISAGELRSLLEDIEEVFAVSVDEQIFWQQGDNNRIISSKDARKNDFLSTMAMSESETIIKDELSFKDIANDIIKLVMQK